MDNVIDKTKKLIDSFESSELISKLDYYKRIVIGNKELLDLIKRYNNSTDNYEKLSLKEKIYKYDEYREYMRKVCHNTPNLNIYQDEVTSLIVENDEVLGVKTKLGEEFKSKKTIYVQKSS